MSTGTLCGTTAVVTGAAGGIGLAIAKRLAREGTAVVVADVNGGGFAAIVDELLSYGAPQAIGVTGDLSAEAGAQALLAASMKLTGRVDILVNNAGGGVIRPFLEHTSETLKATIDRNLWTTLWCCRVFLPAMIEQGAGRIVNIGADSVHTGTYSHAGYNAAKGGVNGLTTGLAFEFGRHGIRINTVSPGGVMTPDLRTMLENAGDVEGKIKLTIDPQAIQETIPIRRFAEMEEVAGLVAFLAGPDAAAINGQIYSINGGQWMM